MILVVGTPLERLVAVGDLAVLGAYHPALRDAALTITAGLVGAEAKARAIHSWVKERPYQNDPRGPDRLEFPPDWLRLPIDCEDRAGLAACLALVVDLASELVWCRQPSEVEDHMTGRVLVDGSWQWVETVLDARFGEDPYDAAARLGGGARVPLRRSLTCYHYRVWWR